MQKVIKSLPSPVNVTKTVVIAAYKEFENLFVLLLDLDKLLPLEVSIVIADDTGVQSEKRIEKIVRESLCEERNWLISFESKKSGRGSAVLRGFGLSNDAFSKIEYFAECDADGSHRPQDIAKILLSPPSDFLIGSRYLPTSKIEGWPRSRRVASKVLNYLIPRVLNIKSTDITNGLRRYSKISTELILKHEQSNTGFIFLSEQALLLSSRGISPVEEPITFVDRIHGESSVGLSEIYDSLYGVFALYLAKRKYKE
jgi:dolichol-phosphate mannosyltransferase